MQVTIDVRATGAEHALAGMRRRALDLRPAWRNIADRVKSSIDRQFIAGGNPAWKPLSAATRARRRKGRGPGSDKILRDTGTLMRAWGSNTAAQGIREVQRLSLAVGVRGYGAYHQLGRGVPQRAVKITDAVVDESVGVIRRYIVG